MSHTHILLVDDDLRIRTLLQRYLRQQGFRVTASAHPREAQEVLSAPLPVHLIILDDMMPYQSGRDFLADLRDKGCYLPVLMLTARGEPSDRIAGLSVGADDYLVKPFVPEELVLRIQGLLRRSAPPAPSQPVAATVRLGGRVYDVARQILTEVDGSMIPLTPTEKTVMDVLVRAGGQAVHRLQLQTALGVEEANFSRTVDVHLNRLRQKIEPNPKMPQYLQTVRHQGYRLHSDDV